MPPVARERSKRERHDEEPRADDDYRRRREGRDAREGSRDVPAYEKDTSNADGESDRDQDSPFRTTRFSTSTRRAPGAFRSPISRVRLEREKAGTP